jgi:hypothetical protein
VTQGEDIARRVREQTQELCEVLGKFDISLAVVEAPAGAKSSAAAAAISRAYALVIAVLEVHQVPVMLAYPWVTRQRLTGSRAGGKVEAARAVAATPGFADLALWLDCVAKNRAEHAWDAAANLVAYAEDPMVRMVCRR